MATSTQLSVPDQIRQLEGARKLVLGDPNYYPQVIQATLPIIGPNAQVEFRRWGAEFLSEAFASPAIALGQKETLSLLALETLKLLAEDPKQDIVVLRSVIQTAASVYPLALRWIINNAYDTTTWKHMTAIKTRILQIWDKAPPTIRICCIKFAQRVVLAQTPSVNREPRRGDPLDISLAMVPQDHSVLDVHSLEAEASGLLDRMIGVLQDNSSDALLVDATLNTLSILVRGRPDTSNRILNAILNFNPLKLANSPMTPKTRVIVRSMEKTTRMLLHHLVRRDSRNQQNPRIHQYLERLAHIRAEVFEGSSRKRALTGQADGLDVKRQRMGPAQMEFQIPPLKTGPHSLADIFTLSQNQGLRTFDVSLVPTDLAARISVNTIARIDPKILERAINGVRDRLAVLHEAAAQPINPETAALDVEDDDDYEPDYHEAEDTEQILNKLDSSEASSPTRELQKPAVLGSLALPTFKLPPPPPLNLDQTAKVAQGTVARLHSVMHNLEEPVAKKSRAGINRLAASAYDRDSWVTVMTRLATRASAGLDDIKREDGQSSSSVVGTAMREQLYMHVLQDFRKHLDTAVTWLNEEWYNDLLQRRSSGSARDCPRHYEECVLRVFDGFLPYLNSGDKILTRFLSEIPEINVAIISRIKNLCRDPSMMALALQSLLYLVIYRPPVKELALDAVQDIWLEYEDARPTAGKYISKWRPGFLEAQKQTDGTPTGAAPSVVAT